jgi:hypothetical protein
LAEWQYWTKYKIKVQAETANVLKTKGGAEKITRLANRYADKTPSGEDLTTEQKAERVTKAIGGRTLILDHTDDFKEHRSDQPADSQQRFWENVARRACAGVNLPLEVVLPQSIQGTMARALFDMADKTFKQWVAFHAEHIARIREHVITIEALNNQALARLPSDWRKIDYTGPKGINVDVGYTSSATLAELEAGLTTEEQFHKDRNRDWKRVQRQRVKEQVNRKKLMDEAGLTASPDQSKKENNNE